MYKLEKGIFLEDQNVLLEWGKPIEKLAIENNAKIIKKSDRIIIEWGKHTILSGLNLELSNTYLLSKLGNFKSIGFDLVGDKQSVEYFNLISTHLEKLFGNPKERNDNVESERERFWVWQIDDVNISLHIFEQHTLKLHFKISKN
jgi:hypothetical protein